MRIAIFIISIVTYISSFAQYNVQTISGTGVSGHTDGGTFSAQYNRPVGITSDVLGNVFICDFSNHCIRKISPNGIVSTIAGLPGVSGIADGNGSNARFNQPGGICVDNLGNIYVTDNFNHRICKIDINNNVTTLAGNGVSGYVDSNGVNARLNVPRDICYNSIDSSLYFPDRNHVIRKLNLNNNNVSTFCGSGMIGFINGSPNLARFNFPASIDNDNSGGFIVTDRDNHAIRHISATGVVTTLSGNGLSGYVDGVKAAAQFNNPVNASIDSLGNIYVTDFSNRRIRRIGLDDTVRTIAGDGTLGYLDGPGSLAKLGEVFDIEVINTNTMYFTDGSNDRIRAITNLTTAITTLKNNAEYTLNVFPNPVKDYLHFENLVSSNYEIKIYNSRGQKVKDLQLFDETHSIDISSLDSGIYFVQLIDKNGNLTSKKITKL